jgi:hypothetical protein
MSSAYFLFFDEEGTFRSNDFFGALNNKEDVMLFYGCEEEKK